MASITFSSVPTAAFFLSSTLSMAILWILCSKRQRVQVQPSLQNQRHKKAAINVHSVKSIKQQQVELVQLEETSQTIISLPPQTSLSEPHSILIPVMDGNTHDTNMDMPVVMGPPAGHDDDGTIVGPTKSTATESVISHAKQSQERSAVGSSSNGSCYLRSTIPLRLDRKPPCRPTLKPHSLNYMSTTTMEMTTVPPPPPTPPGPQPAKVLELPQGPSTPSQTSVRSSSHTCMSCEHAHERKEKIPFNGVPALLAVLPTPNQQNHH